MQYNVLCSFLVIYTIVLKNLYNCFKEFYFSWRLRPLQIVILGKIAEKTSLTSEYLLLILSDPHNDRFTAEAPSASVQSTILGARAYRIARTPGHSLSIRFKPCNAHPKAPPS